MLEIQVLNWRKFQHYHSNRSLRWVKVYINLLDDWEYRCLSPPARAFLLDLWLLSGKTLDGILRGAAKDIAWRLRVREPEMLEWLQEVAAVRDTQGDPKWIRVSASNLPQNASPEEKRREEKRELQKPSAAQRPQVASEEPTLSAEFTRAAVDAYRTTAGGIGYPRILRVLKRLVGAHGEADVLARWADYCKAGRNFGYDGKTWSPEPLPLKHLTPERFRDTFDRWGAQ